MAANEKKKAMWDCHKHRDELKVSDFATVYHLEHGQLCYREEHYDVFLYYPIEFKNRAAAHKWIQEGTIGELQENHQHLGIVFSTASLKKREQML